MLISLSALIEESWHLYTKYWVRLVAYFGILFAPTVVLTLLGVAGIYMDSYLPITQLASNIVILLVFVAGLLLSFWATLALTYHLRDLLQNQPELTWKGYMARSAPNLTRALITSIIVVLVIIAGGVLFLIPGLIFTIWYAFSLYPVLFEGKKPLESMSMSKKLVQGRWWKMAWRIVVPSTLFVAAFRIAELIILVPAGYFLPNGVLGLLTNLTDALAAALATPLTIVPLLIVYKSAQENPATITATPPPQI